MNSKSTYTIKEVSQMFHLTASTLRYYEEMGLITNVKRSTNHQRIYTQDHLDQIEGILYFKRTGMPIIKIKEFFQHEDDYPNNIDKVIQLVEEHEQNLLHRLKALQDDLRHIQKKVRYFKAVKESYVHDLPMPDYDTI